MKHRLIRVIRGHSSSSGIGGRVLDQWRAGNVRSSSLTGVVELFDMRRRLPTIRAVMPDFVEGVKWYLAFVFSTTVHEAAHAWSALKLGDDTAHQGGQVTLDPTPHITRSPIGMVAAPILSYLMGGWMLGWASAPYDPQWAIRYPRRAALMSMAGPASNVLLMVIAALLIRAGMLAGFFDAPDVVDFARVTEAAGSGVTVFLAKMLSIFFSMNLLLAIFNLIPLPPLDGSCIFMFFSSSESAAKYLGTFRAQWSIIGLLISWRVMDAIFPSIQLFAVNLLYPGHHYHPT